MDIFRGEPMPRSWDWSWWGRHLYNNTVADMVTVIDDMYKNAAAFASLQVVGYCYGGGVAAGLTAVDRPVLSAVSAHPTWEDPQGRSELGELETLVNTNTSIFFIMVHQQTHPPQHNHSHTTTPQLHTSTSLIPPASFLSSLRFVVPSRTTILSSTIRRCGGSTRPLNAT